MKKRQQGILTGMPFMANLAPRTFVDDLGRKIYLAKPPTRIVSLAPSITEMLYALGAGQQVLAVTECCNYPSEATTKPKLNYSRPDLTFVRELRPDLVLGSRRLLVSGAAFVLEQANIPTLLFEPKSIDYIFGHILTVGRVLERSPAADELVGRMRRHLGDILRLIEGLPRPRVLYLLSWKPLITVGPAGFLSNLIELAGGTNVALSADAAYPRFTSEEVVRADPEAIIYTGGAMQDNVGIEREIRESWPGLSAIRQGRIHCVPGELVNRPGPRIIQGLEAFVRMLHPERFASVRGA